MNRTRYKGATFIFLGISGSGKGTQTARLLKEVGGVNISTGEFLRRVAKKPNRVGRHIKGILDRGGLVPYWAAAFAWLRSFTEDLKGDESVVLDGAPRRVKEAEMMDDFMSSIGRSSPRAIYLKVSPKEAYRRLLGRGRYDDNAQAIQGRFQFFQKNVMPVVRYYQRRRRLVVIDGDRSPDEVWRDIRRALK